MRRAGVVILLAALAATVAAPTGGGTAGHLESPAAGPFDLQAFIDSQVKAGTRQIVVPRGRYRVKPRDQQHLVLRDLHDTAVVADGVEMICTETTRALTITHCTNVTVSGLVIDYDPLPFTQGRITGFSNNKKIHEVELLDGYPSAEAARSFKYEIFRPDTRTLRCDDRYPSKVEVVDPRHIRVHNPGGRASDPEQAGDLIVIGAEYAPHGSIPHAVECEDSAGVRLENITLYASNCFGFFEENCSGSTYDHCRVDRRPAAEDPVKRGDARLRSLDADAFHSKYAVKGPAYIACTAKFMGDDAVNINGDYHMVMASQGKELRVLAKGDMNILAGDLVELVRYDGQRLPDAKAVAVQPDGSIHGEERAFLSRQAMDDDLKAARESLNKAFTITLDREVSLPMGSVIAAANRIGNGFSVKDCIFGFNRSRGILIKASRGEVSDNLLEGSRLSAILVSPEYWWLEAGSSSDVKIIGNTILNCSNIPICVEAAGADGRIAPAGVHRNITISGNTVKGSPKPGILVTSTTGLRIENNTLDLLGGSLPVPGRMRQAGLEGWQPVTEINCQREGSDPE